MFFRKQIKEDIESISKRLFQLECPHDINNLIIASTEEYTIPPYGEWPQKIWKKYCRACGKVFEFYKNKNEYLKAKNELMRQLIKINEKILNE